MTPQNRFRQLHARTNQLRFWKKSVALLGLGFWAGSLALLSPSAQSQSGTPYCFVVREVINVYSSPSQFATVEASYRPGDITYATANPPRTIRGEDGVPYVEVAIYGGNLGWLPRYDANRPGAELIVDLSSDQCTNPGPGAFGYVEGGGIDSSGGEYCFAVQTPVNVYSSPSYFAMTNDTFAIGDTAYATANPPNSVWIDDPNFVNGNSFIEVKIWGGSTGWVPRFKVGADLPVLMDLATCP
ncbi:MAG: hypothetical protein AAGG53_12000 [Cyanobacteria bacterium P01_H01_bin.152]